jgi:thiol-disulfide isomerase/thioredoxin
MKSRVLLYVVVAAIAAMAGAAISLMFLENPNESTAAAGPQALLGKPRPPFTLGASDGQRVSADDFTGDVLLINFWATWCTPCRKEMPMLVELHEALGDQGLSVVGIALDDVQRARDFAEELGVSYTVLVGAADVMATGFAYGNSAGLLPYTVLVDRQGIVRWTFLGELKRADLEREINALL